MKNQCFFTSKTHMRRASQSTDARLVLGLPGVRGWDLSPAQRAWQCPELCADKLCVHILPSLQVRSPAPEHMWQHMSPHGWQTCDEFLFLIQVLECMCISCIDTALNQNSFTDWIYLQCAFLEMHFSPNVFHQLLSQQPSWGNREDLSKTSNLLTLGLLAGVMPLEAKALCRLKGDSKKGDSQDKE